MYKHIAVCLDLSTRDQTLIAYASWLHKVFQPERMTLLHVTHVSYLPEMFREKYFTTNHIHKLEARIRSEILQSIQSDTDFSPAIEVIEGHPLEGMMHWAEGAHVDLMVVGKSREPDASVVIPEKLARELECSLLLIPQGASTGIRHILCPIDFSGPAQQALNAACLWSNALPAKSLNAYHVYLPPMYQYDVELEFSDAFEWDYERFDRELEHHASKKLDAVVAQCAKLKPGVSMKTQIEGRGNPGAAILDLVGAGGYDLCMVGGRGDGRREIHFWGSLTTKLMLKIKIPLLVQQQNVDGATF